VANCDKPRERGGVWISEVEASGKEILEEMERLTAVLMAHFCEDGIDD
jgi:hypothetical protein